MGGPRYSKPELERMRALLDAGLSYKQIAKELGRNETRVTYYARRLAKEAAASPTREVNATPAPTATDTPSLTQIIAYTLRAPITDAAKLDFISIFITGRPSIGQTRHNGQGTDISR